MWSTRNDSSGKLKTEKVKAEYTPNVVINLEFSPGSFSVHITSLTTRFSSFVEADCEVEAEE